VRKKREKKNNEEIDKEKMNAKKKVFLYFSVMYFLLHIDLMGYTKTDTASNKERKIIF